MQTHSPTGTHDEYYDAPSTRSLTEDQVKTLDQVDERSRVIGWDESLSGPIIHNPIMNVRAIIKPAGSFKRLS